jgi:hypothetical protein
MFGWLFLSVQGIWENMVCDYNVTYYFVWVWNLISDIKGIHIEGVWEQDAEVSIWI